MPPNRERYLSDIAGAVRSYHKQTKKQAAKVRQVWQLKTSHDYMAKKYKGKKGYKTVLDAMRAEVHDIEEGYTDNTHKLLAQWPEMQKAYSGREYKYKVRDKQFSVPLTTRSLCGLDIPKVCLPKWEDPAEVYAWMRSENVPGSFPFTAGVFPFKRTDEDPPACSPARATRSAQTAASSC